MDTREVTGPGSEGKSAPEQWAMYSAMLASLPTDVYPNLVRLITESGPAVLDDDVQFDYGLQRMFDGMEAEVHRSTGSE
jgi:hypothetical protein